MSCDPDILAGCRKIGIYGNISKDALQADVPTQQPTKFQLVINLKAAADAARAHGVTNRNPVCCSA